MNTIKISISYAVINLINYAIIQFTQKGPCKDIASINVNKARVRYVVAKIYPSVKYTKSKRFVS